MMAHAQTPDFVFRRNGRVHLNRRGRQFSRLLAAEVCASAVVMLDTPCSEVVWRVLATHSIRHFPLQVPSRTSPCAITFQLEPTPVRLVDVNQKWRLQGNTRVGRGETVSTAPIPTILMTSWCCLSMSTDAVLRRPNKRRVLLKLASPPVKGDFSPFTITFCMPCMIFSLVPPPPCGAAAQSGPWPPPSWGF